MWIKDVEYAPGRWEIPELDDVKNNSREFVRINLDEATGE